MRRATAGGTEIGSATSPWALLGGALILATLAATAIPAGVTAWRVAVLLVVAPLTEEALFRAGLHDALLRLAVAPWLANAATAFAFGLAHALLRGDFAALAVAWPALLIGAAYQRTRRLRHCVALHAAMNALWLGAGLLGPFHVPAE